MSDLTKDCVHCGTLFHPVDESAEFCCAGCEVVHRLLFSEGLDRFYTLKGSHKVRPARDRPFQAVETDWIETLVAKAEEETEEGHASTTVHISGTTCVGCVWLIETLFQREPGAISATVDPTAAEGTFTWKKGTGTLLNFAKELPRYGYSLDSITSDRGKYRESTQLLARLGVSGAFALNTMAFSLPRYLGMDDSFQFSRLFDLVALISSTLTLLIGGSYFFKKAIGAASQKSIHIDLPIAMGLALAYIGSIVGWMTDHRDLLFFDFVAIFTTLMLGGRYIHLIAIEKVSHRLQGQSAILSEITLKDQTRKPTKELQPGDIFELPPGRALPVSARITGCDSEFSLAWMTGEIHPKLFPKGRNVPAGAISLSSQNVEFMAIEAFGESLVSKLYDAAKAPPPTTTSGPFLKIYLIAIIVIGLLAGLGWIVAGHSTLIALQITISIFVISCPCAIGIALPLVEKRIASAMAKQGVFIQKPGFWSKLTKVRNLILDKTGTLTLEHPEMVNSIVLNDLTGSAKEALSILSANSLHPLDRTIHQHLVAMDSHYASTASAEVKSRPGLGNTLSYRGDTWTLGRPGWRGDQNFQDEGTESLACELAVNGQSLAVFVFEESLRPEAIRSAQWLQKGLKIKLHILSGDNQSRIDEFSSKLGIPRENATGNLSPDEKQERTKALQPALYLGDGMNDAAAFSESLLSGTPVTDRSVLDRNASFIFTCQGLAFLPNLFKAARWSRETSHMVIAFAIVYNLAAIATCCLGSMTPLLASILMPLSSLACIGIALRPVKLSNRTLPPDQPERIGFRHHSVGNHEQNTGFISGDRNI
ncbi:MAG: heavy metal translocating P-type ATPase metal-binding domain-containing protein [Verrucomicrobiales bacterium]|nr:heavy metal translocating P-type ATPase metal-binding domain-containing protein [Verrucomicrobiales bacterium]